MPAKHHDKKRKKKLRRAVSACLAAGAFLSAALLFSPLQAAQTEGKETPIAFIIRHVEYWFMWSVPQEPPCIERRKEGDRVVAVREPVESVTEEESRRPVMRSQEVPLLQAGGDPAGTLEGYQSPFQGEPLDLYGVPLRWGSLPLYTKGKNQKEVRRPSLFARLRSTPTHVSGRQMTRTLAYIGIVRQCAASFHLRERMLLAIIQAESNGSSSCVSPACAIGLMQVQPHTAGVEVARFLGESEKNVSLSDPAKNIRYGAAYLHLLEKRYFSRIKDALTREICVITAYNAGPGNLFRLFGRSRGEALQKINSFTPDEVFDEITTRAPKGETRQYLSKIYSLMHFYATMGY